MGRPVVNKAGLRFGKLVVIRLHHQDEEGRAWWTCKCDCGKTAAIFVGKLNCSRNSAKSCGQGCMKTGRKPVHGMTGTKEHRAWMGMVKRCYNHDHHKYHLYGGRGIKICKAWRIDFMAFYRDVGPAPSPKHSIDRRDPNGHYKPGNVRWASVLQQRHNQRRYT